MAARSAASKSKSVRSTSHKIVLIIRYLQKQSKLLFFRVRDENIIPQQDYARNADFPPLAGKIIPW